MKATIKFPAIGQESYWQKGDDGKAVCRITVTGEDGKDYKVRIQEGTPEWAKSKGDHINIELRVNKSTGEQYAVLEGTPQSTSRPSYGGGYNKPVPQPLTPERAKEMALLAVAIYKTIAEKLHDVTPAPTSEDIRTITNTILMR